MLIAQKSKKKERGWHRLFSYSWSTTAASHLLRTYLSLWNKKKEEKSSISRLPLRDYLPSSIRRTSGVVVLPSNMVVKWTVHREVGKQPLYYYRGPVREREKREEERERYTFWRPENTTHPTYMLDYYCNKYSPTSGAPTGSWFGNSRLCVGLVGRRGPKSVQPR